MPARIYSAGSNAHGQLAHGGVDDSHTFKECIFIFDDAQQDGNFELLSITTGANHTLVLLRNQGGSVAMYGCGDGSKGQLGSNFHSRDGDLTNFHRLDFAFLGGRCVKLIAACWETSFVVVTEDFKSDDVLWSLGSNAYGLRGNAKSIDQHDPEPSLVDFSSVRKYIHSVLKISSITAGPHHVIVNLTETTADETIMHIVGWGASRHGQLGLSKVPYLSTPTALYIEDSDEFALGIQHTIACTRGRSIITMGSNKKNQLQGLTGCSNVVAIGATWNASYVVTSPRPDKSDWRICVSGSSVVKSDVVKEGDGPFTLWYQKLPFDTTSYTFLGLSCGSEHVLLHVKSTDYNQDRQPAEAWGWGWNEHGNLGTGDTNDVIVPKLIWSSCDATADVDLALARVHAGYGTSWIIIESGQQHGTVRDGITS